MSKPDVAKYDVEKIKKRWEPLAPHNDTTLDYALSELFRCLDKIAQRQAEVDWLSQYAEKAEGSRWRDIMDKALKGD